MVFFSGYTSKGEIIAPPLPPLPLFRGQRKGGGAIISPLLLNDMGRAAGALVYLGCLSFFPLVALECSLPLAFFFLVCRGAFFFSEMPK